MSYREQIYGELVDLDLLLSFINAHVKQINSVLKKYKFYDFGSGYGNIVLSYSKYFDKCIGIEIVKNRHDFAINKNMENNTIFKNENFFSSRLENPFVLLVNNLCFGIGTNKRLSQKILSESITNDIIIVTKKLDLLNEYYKDYNLIDCTWGETEIYIYVIKK